MKVLRSRMKIFDILTDILLIYRIKISDISNIDRYIIDISNISDIQHDIGN